LDAHGSVLEEALAGRGGIERLFSLRSWHSPPAPALVGESEALPFANGSLDAVFSLLSLHWVNDLPGTLRQVQQVLRPDGLFLAAMLGGEALRELRQALLQAESELEGGASPRVSPFAELRDAAALLQRAGFALP